MVFLFLCSRSNVLLVSSWRFINMRKQRMDNPPLSYGKKGSHLPELDSVDIILLHFDRNE